MYTQIKLAINELLDNHFGVDINSNDVKEGFVRPSFFVRFDDPITSSNLTHIERSFTVRINYFPSDMYSYSIELLEVQEKLESIFDLKLHVGDRYLNINEVSCVESDGVLVFSFDLSFITSRYISYEDEKRYIGDNNEPMLDENGAPIKIELMKTMDLKKGLK